MPSGRHRFAYLFCYQTLEQIFEGLTAFEVEESFNDIGRMTDLVLTHRIQLVARVLQFFFCKCCICISIQIMFPPSSDCYIAIICVV